MKQSEAEKLEKEFAYWVRVKGLPDPVREHIFHPTRKWRFDFAWPEHKVAAELEGGIYSGGRHVRGTGFVKDCEKYNAAALLGWRVLRFTARDLVRGGAVLTVLELLGVEPDQEKAKKARDAEFEIF